jgi:hopene-associated glycosyltransferase HpnB
MATGVRAVSPGTEYVLFTDADIAWTAPRSLRELVAASVTDNRDLVSQMARLHARTFWERAIVPAFVYFFAQLYPFRWVNHGTRTAAAAGGCMLVRREALTRAGGLEKIKGAIIDDVALGGLLKRAGGRCWLGLSADIVSVRPYPRLSDLWQMIARSAYNQLRYNPLLLAGTIAGLLLIYAVPPAGLIAGLVANDPATAALGGAAWVLMSVSYLPMLAFYRLSPLRAPTLPLIAIGYAAMTADSARRHHASSPVAWRGKRAAPRPLDNGRLRLPAWRSFSSRGRPGGSGRYCAPGSRARIARCACLTSCRSAPERARRRSQRRRPTWTR